MWNKNVECSVPVAVAAFQVSNRSVGLVPAVSDTAELKGLGKAFGGNGRVAILSFWKRLFNHKPTKVSSVSANLQ